MVVTRLQEWLIDGLTCEVICGCVYIMWRLGAYRSVNAAEYVLIFLGLLAPSIANNIALCECSQDSENLPFCKSSISEYGALLE
jgi:hypothetical protein